MPVATDIQHVILIRSLLEKAHTTMELKDINILCPAARVMECRDMGFFILTTESEYIDSDGESHIIGKYVLLPQRNDLNNRGKELLKRVLTA